MASPHQPPPMAQPRVAAGVLFFDEHDRVLLVQPSYKPGWDIPGGYVEPGESPLDACKREISEELGIEPPIGPLLVIDWAPHPDEGDKLLFVFDGGLLPVTLCAAIRLAPTELNGFAFHPRESVQSSLAPRLARRVIEALRARQTGRPEYIECGRRPVVLSR